MFPQARSKKRPRSEKTLTDSQRIFKQTSLSPWIDWREFEAVGRAVLRLAVTAGQGSTNGDAGPYQVPSIDIEDALDRVAVWRTRTHSLPHAIDSSAALAQLLWRHSTLTLSTTELRLAYASAITRSINGLVDVLQQQRAAASSVSILSAQLGLDGWLVDIRHASTHNQLPSLSVLRTAAETMLGYFGTVYWEPLFENRREKVEYARELLDEYQAAAMAWEEAKKVNENEEQDPEANVEETVSEEEEEEDAVEDVDVPNKLLGTSFNRFALLMPQKKKSKPSSPPKQKKKERKKKNTPQKKLTNPSVCARRFVRSAKYPVDLALDVALTFLVGDSTYPGALLGVGQGVDFVSLRDRYAPLIVAVGQQWTGFVAALATRLVDSVIAKENAEKPSTEEDSSLHSLQGWIEFLLSKDYIAQLNPDLLSSVDGGVDPERELLAALQSLEVPLNALCDRCQHANGIVSRRIAARFEQVLLEQRVPCFGAARLSQSERDEQAEKSNDDKKTGVPLKLEGPLSLDQMEALLNGEGPPVAAEPPANSMPNDNQLTPSSTLRPAWTRCTIWEPSAIGVMPGHAPTGP